MTVVTVVARISATFVAVASVVDADFVAVVAVLSVLLYLCRCGSF